MKDSSANARAVSSWKTVASGSAPVSDLLMEAKVKELTSALAQKKAELEVVSKELEAFSYSVSHDLRAPLRGVIGFSQIFLEDFGDSLSTEAKSTIQRVTNSARKMGQLIDGLLELSRMTRKPLVRQDVNLTSLVHNIAIELQGQSERKVSFEIANDVSVKGDQALLKAALTNLLSNSWKFTAKQSSPKVVFGVQKIEEKLVYFVQDNGCGFDMKYVGKLFGLFQRLHTDREFDGTGIGLAVTQRIIHRHGGKIWVESEPSKGTTVYFTTH